MGSTYNGRLFSVIEEEKQPVAMMWDWQVFDLDGWVIPKGAPQKKVVMEFLKFATDTQRLADQAKYHLLRTGTCIVCTHGWPACRPGYRYGTPYAYQSSERKTHTALQL